MNTSIEPKGVARERDRTSLFADGRFPGADTRQKQRDRAARFLGSRPRHRRYSGYEGRGAGGKTLESATYFIRENDEIVGMLCVNTDLSTVRSINAMAQQLMACFDAVPRQAEPASIEVESLSESTQELIDRSIAELLSARGLDVASL